MVFTHTESHSVMLSAALDLPFAFKNFCAVVALGVAAPPTSSRRTTLLAFRFSISSYQLLHAEGYHTSCPLLDEEVGDSSARDYDTATAGVWRIKPDHRDDDALDA